MKKVLFMIALLMVYVLLGTAYTDKEGAEAAGNSVTVLIVDRMNINDCLEWCNECRIKVFLGSTSPMEYRRSLGLVS